MLEHWIPLHCKPRALPQHYCDTLNKSGKTGVWYSQQCATEGQTDSVTVQEMSKQP